MYHIEPENNSSSIYVPSDLVFRKGVKDDKSQRELEEELKKIDKCESLERQ